MIEDEELCQSCSIRVGQLVQIGDVDGPGAIPGMPESVVMDGKGRYWVTFSGEPPMVFDSTGRLAFTFSRGRGPGEFQYASTLIPVPGDSVLVIDPGLARGTVISPDLRPARTIRMPIPAAILDAAILDWPGNLVFHSLVPTRERVGLPFHGVSLSGADVLLSDAFGGTGELRPGDEHALRRTLSRARANRFWAADVHRYRLRQWNDQGELLRTLERRPAWFDGTSSFIGMGPASPPPPIITAVEEDVQGRLWVFVGVPSAQWPDAWADVPRGSAGGEIPVSRGPRLDLLYRTVVEVIDTDEQRVLVRGSLDEFIIAVLPAGNLATYSEGADGVPVIRISALILEESR